MLHVSLHISEWLRGDSGQPTPPEARLKGRNCEWTHLNNKDVVSVPDKWEYPYVRNLDM